MKKLIRFSFLILVSVFVSASLGVRGQACLGSFLFYNHYGYFSGDFSCWQCGYNLLAVVAIKEPTQGRLASIRVSIKDSTGARFSHPGGGFTSGIPMGIIYTNNQVWWGNISPHWMGVTSPSWYWGRQSYVMVGGASYQTNCNYSGPLTINIHAQTYIPLVGDTCLYDTTIIFPHCNPLGLWHEVTETPQPQPEPVRVFNTYDITGRNTSGGGLIILQMEDGTFRKRVILDK